MYETPSNSRFGAIRMQSRRRRLPSLWRSSWATRLKFLSLQRGSRVGKALVRHMTVTDNFIPNLFTFEQERGRRSAIKKPTPRKGGAGLWFDVPVRELARGAMFPQGSWLAARCPHEGALGRGPSRSTGSAQPARSADPMWPMRLSATVQETGDRPNVRMVGSHNG